LLEREPVSKAPRFLVGPAPTAAFPALAPAYLRQRQNDRLYRIFYPLSATDPAILFSASNPWRFTCAAASTGK
jgi:hypothetical protein